MNDQDGHSRKPIPKLWAKNETPEIETASVGNLTITPLPSLALEKRATSALDNWCENPSFENALSAIDIAASVSDKTPFFPPARQIRQTRKAKLLARRLANFVLGEKIEDPMSLLVAKPSLNQQIAEARSKLSEGPRNAHLWVELARLHTFSGSTKNASKAFQAALALAPDDRFVLRSLCRFSVHAVGTKDFEEAPFLAREALAMSDRIRFDPWVQAAEIALSDLLDLTPNSIGTGRKVLSAGDHSPLTLSELASAMGTLEMATGSHKRGLRLVEQSLSEPTANALSQASWLNSRDGITLRPKLSELGVSVVNEAAAYEAMNQEEWAVAIARLKDWQSEEPFSSFVAAEGSFYALGTVFDADAALNFCDVGLKANPMSKLLLNNRIVALCMAKRGNEATRQMDAFVKASPNWQSDPVTCATKGLVSFTTGAVNEGRNWYIQAVKLADKTKDLDLCFRVRAHWLFEESVRFQIPPDLIDSVVAELDSFLTKVNLPRGTLNVWKTMKSKIQESRAQCSLDEIVKREMAKPMQVLHLTDEPSIH